MHCDILTFAATNSAEGTSQPSGKFKDAGSVLIPQYGGHTLLVQ